MNKAKGVVAFLTLGCKVNTYETNAMQLLFTQAGYEITDFSKTADYLRFRPYRRMYP